MHAKLTDSEVLNHTFPFMNVGVSRNFNQAVMPACVVNSRGTCYIEQGKHG